MKEIMKVYSNWHCVALITLAMCAFVLAISESDSILILVATKVVALTLCGICAFLAKLWAKQGKINELLNLKEE